MNSNPTHPEAPMLPRAMNIARLALAFGRQTRATYHEDGIRKETDTDHTVMLSLLVADLAQLPSLRDRLDLGEVLSYALVHDVVEAYAGDTVSIRLTAEERAAKKAREAAALERLRDELGADAWLVRKIESYEHQDTLEARFVHFADKIVPKFTHAMNGGRTMRDLGFDLTMAAAQHTAQLAELAGGSPDLPEMAALFHEAHEAAIQGIAKGLETERVAGRQVIRWTIPGPVSYVEGRATIPEDDGKLLERGAALTKMLGFPVMITAPDPDACADDTLTPSRAAIVAVPPNVAAELVAQRETLLAEWVEAFTNIGRAEEEAMRSGPAPWPTLADADTDSPPAASVDAAPGYDDNEP